MEKTKILRSICVVILVIATLWYGINIYSNNHVWVFGAIAIGGAMQALLHFLNTYSTKIGFEHILSCGFSVISGCIAILASGANMVWGYWALAIMLIPMVLSLLPPIFYSGKWEVHKWREALAFCLVLVAIFMWDWLEKTPNYFNSYIAIQILVVSIVTMFLPNKDELKEDEK